MLILKTVNRLNHAKSWEHLLLKFYSAGEIYENFGLSNTYEMRWKRSISNFPIAPEKKTNLTPEIVFFLYLQEQLYALILFFPPALKFQLVWA